MLTSSKPPGLLLTVGALACTRIHLRLFGMRRSILRARAIGHPRDLRAEDFGAAAAMARRIEEAGAVFLGRARCLEQSITLFALLRRRGIPVELKLGAQALPFVAHAWVELDGRLLNSDPEFTANLVPFPTMQ